MQTLQDRVANHLIELGHADKINAFVSALTPEAIANNDRITDESIHNQIMSQLLFWGLGEALANYIQWERTQI